MANNKNAQLRYQILDRCFSDFNRKYTIEDLLNKVNEAYAELYGTSISIRQLRSDIKDMRDSVIFNAPIVAYQLVGRKCFYRYAKQGYSIYRNELSIEEMTSLCSMIKLLRRYRGLPNYAWLENALSNFEIRFGLKPNSENIVSFEHNDLLKGAEFLGDLIDAALSHQPLNIVYRTFAGVESVSTIHPYHLKQFNNRWFLIGLQVWGTNRMITNKALDRIVSFSPADVDFIPNTEIDFAVYFKDVLGVTIPEDHPHPEEVLLQFEPERFPYVVNKPIHPTQEIYDERQGIIRLMVRPNKELEARIFSYGNQVQVLAPIWLKNQIMRKIELLIKKYATVQADCSVEI